LGLIAHSATGSNTRQASAIRISVILAEASRKAYPENVAGSKLQCPNWSKAVADLKDLLGTWTVLSWKKEIIATGQIVDAHGPDPVGYITYGSDGRMHVIVVRRDRLGPETLPPTDTESYAFSIACLPNAFSTALSAVGSED
jgi:hypothetical protein